MKTEQIEEVVIPAKPATRLIKKKVIITCDDCKGTVYKKPGTFFSGKCYWCKKDICINCAGYAYWPKDGKCYGTQFCSKCWDLFNKFEVKAVKLYEETDKLINDLLKKYKKQALEKK